jgi:hypothetical protein
VTISLRIYGWADQYGIGKTQAGLVAVDRLRLLSQAILIETDPDDDSIARENACRGWPERLVNPKGEPCDWVVIPIGERLSARTLFP